MTATPISAGSDTKLKLPARMAEFVGSAPVDPRPIPARERLFERAASALRTAEVGLLDTGLSAELAAALLAWYGPQLVIDKGWLLLALDRDVAEIDAVLSEQVNEILHAEAFQRLEARWRGLSGLAEVADQSSLARVRILTVSWTEIARDLERATDFDRSQMFAKIYTEELGMLGGQPFGLLIGDYEIQHRASADHPTDDIAALKAFAAIAAAAFAPLIMAASPRLFQLESFSALGRPFDLRTVFRHADYLRWRSLCDMEETRFVGLALPRVLMRLPYRLDIGRRDGFRFEETVSKGRARDHLWGSAAFAFASVILRAFANFNWFADIRGVTRDEVRGGLVTDLPVAWFGTDAPGIAGKPSIEALLSDRQEKDLSDLGFIALRRIPFSSMCVFYSNQSLHSPPRYDRPAANANARLSGMLQYVLCVCRFAHYIKLLGRTYVGTMKTAEEIQAVLQAWLMNYCLGNSDASQDSKARSPLREAAVEVKEIPGRAGVYSCALFLRPHFQLDDVSTGFRLVTQLAPSANAA